MFFKNVWYVVCMFDEIESKFLGCQICGEKIVFYCGVEGKVVVVEDFCLYCGVLLLLGFVWEGQLVCGYYGLEMGCDGYMCSMLGQCVCGFFCICSFLVVECYGFIWVWFGDKEQVDLVQIYYLEWVENFEWVYGGGLYYINCDYCLMIDNFMDFMYEIYVYVFSIGQKEIDEVLVNMWVEGEQVIISCFMENIMLLLFWCMVL